MDIPSSVALLLGILFKMLGVLFVTATITWPVLYVMQLHSMDVLRVFLQQRARSNVRDCNSRLRIRKFTFCSTRI